jgi:hypothetical protein
MDKNLNPHAGSDFHEWKEKHEAEVAHECERLHKENEKLRSGNRAGVIAIEENERLHAELDRLREEKHGLQQDLNYAISSHEAVCQDNRKLQSQLSKATREYDKLLNFCAGYISGTKDFRDQHPQTVKEWLQEQMKELGE